MQLGKFRAHASALGKQCTAWFKVALEAALVLTLLVALVPAKPVAAQGSSSATVFGSLGNFDVVNNTGHDAHGFEIQLEGLTQNDVYYTFSAQRYGAPTVVPYATGVYVRWASPWDNNAQQFAQTTLAHPANTPFVQGGCYQWNGASYDTSGCEHFGVSLRANATQTTYRWLIADPQTPGALIAVDPPAAIPGPVWIILPPAQPADPPQLVAEIQAPEPPEAPELYGDAQWVKIFKTELTREVTLDELVSDNAIVPQDAAHVEVAWDILQASPPSNGNQRRHRNQGGLAAGTRAVIRRYETYAYTGAYDPVTHQAICADGTCTAPQPGELGDFLGAQMAAANVGVPAIIVTKVGNGNVSSASPKLSCGNVCAATVPLNTLVTLTASPASGNVFSGWSGACTGTSLSCTITVNDVMTATATFALQFTLSIGRGGSGAVVGTPAGNAGTAINCGNSCSAKFTQGTTVTLTATPAAGLRFINWTGACSGTAPTCNVTITKDTQVQANFAK
ncbi:MAG: hypothetical protein U0350_27840 [Caldilineaceae bacterium]